MHIFFPLQIDLLTQSLVKFHIASFWGDLISAEFHKRLDWPTNEIIFVYFESSWDYTPLTPLEENFENSLKFSFKIHLNQKFTLNPN